MTTQHITGNDFKIKFDGEQHQVEANVLIGSLIHTTTILQEINKEINSGKKLEIKVKALEKGKSFAKGDTFSYRSVSSPNETHFAY